MNDLSVIIHPHQFFYSTTSTTTSDQLFHAIQIRLMNKGKLYIIPNGDHNGLFCMTATLSDQSMSQRLRSHSLKPPQTAVRPILVCNGQFHSTRVFRSKQLFDKWYQTHCYDQCSSFNNIKAIPRVWDRRIGSVENGKELTADTFLREHRRQLYDDILEFARNESTTVKELKRFTSWMK